MTKLYSFVCLLVFTLMVYSCSRKHTPQKTNPAASANINTEAVTKKSDSVAVSKKTYKPTQKDIIPNVIVVNDKVARKSIDGRYYYDLLGHRYWRNNKDGKYYLFNKSMYSNDAFKAPGK